MSTIKLLKQPSTIFGIIQVIIGLVLMYTGHQETGTGLITTGFACILYQGNSK